MQIIHALQDRDNPNSLSARFRRARARHVIALISAIYAKKGECLIIDLGGEPNYWTLYDRSFLEKHGVRILLVNLEPQIIDDPLFEAGVGDACSLPQYADNSFDLVHSNSVIEHVGDWARMEAFAREARRLAPRYYVQTPNFGFPVEPHFSSFFFHWRSEQARARLLMQRRRGFADQQPDIGAAMHIVQSARLLDDKQFGFLFPDAEHFKERVMGLTKSLIAIRR